MARALRVLKFEVKQQGYVPVQRGLQSMQKTRRSAVPLISHGPTACLHRLHAASRAAARGRSTRSGTRGNPLPVPLL